MTRPSLSSDTWGRVLTVHLHTTEPRRRPHPHDVIAYGIVGLVCLAGAVLWELINRGVL